MAGLIRVAKRNTTRDASDTRFQRGLSPTVSVISVEDGPRHRNTSMCKMPSYGLRLDRTTAGPCYSISSSHTQRRLRSALPDDYYDYDDEMDNDGSSAAPTSTVAKTDSAKPFLLADIGEGITEVELLRWFVEEGQAISEFDPVCEVQSDKATVEITSRYEGKVQKLAHQSTGSMIQVGEPILWILENEKRVLIQHDLEEQQKKQEYWDSTPKEEPSATAIVTASLSSPEDDSLTMQTLKASASTHDATSIPQAKQQPSSIDIIRLQEEDMGITPTKILTSPAVRKLSRDHRLDLSTVTGTGPSGRILKGDILAILEESPMASKASTNTAATNGIHETTEEWNHPVREDIVVPLRGYKRIMADTMTASLKIPHMVYSDEISLNRFVRYKMEQQQLDHHNHLEKNSKKLLFLPLVIKAASKALEEYPWLNASFDDAKHEVTLWKDHNIGIAMDTPRGLIVPVIQECQNLSLPELAEELKRLKASAMEGGGGIPAKDLTGATFTLSNVGAIGGGGTCMSPIVTPPQVAIGALGQIRRLPRYVTPSSTDPAPSQTIEETHICAVSWAADHRVVDGATVARFHKRFKEYMEDPIKLLLELR